MGQQGTSYYSYSLSLFCTFILYPHVLDSIALGYLVPTLQKMGYNKKQLKESTKPLYDFGGKRIEPIRVITLPFSFGTPQNPHTEYITLDVVHMLYPYNAIFRRGLLNTFEVVLHPGYLYLKVPATFSIITVFGSQKETRTIERGLAP
jgi:hypothetical protein